MDLLPWSQMGENVADEPLTPDDGAEFGGFRGRRYRLVRLERAGTHGQSFLAEAQGGDLKPGDDHRVFVKIPIANSSRGIEATDERLNRIEAGFRREYQRRVRLRDVKGVAHVLDYGQLEIVDPRTEHSYIVPCLVQEYIDGIPFRQYLESRYPSRLDGEFRGITDQEEFFSLARDLLGIIRRVHNRSIVHGDLWPDNILMVGSSPIVVDFGQSFMFDESEFMDGGGVRAHPYLAPERLTKQRTWTSTADLYSIGGVLLYMATGSGPDEIWRDLRDDELKDKVYEKLKTRNPPLLQDNLGISKVIDKCLRVQPEDRYQYAESVIEALDVFDYMTSGASEASTQELLSEISSGIAELESGNGERNLSLFVDLMKSELSYIRMRLEYMKAGHLEILGDREELINSLLRYLVGLNAGDEYATVTAPAFWTDKNLGVNGRFLTMNKMMALRGVAVRRVFMLTPGDLEHENFDRLIKAQMAAIDEMERNEVETDISDLSQMDGKRLYYTGFTLMGEEERRARIERSEHVAIWRKKQTGEKMAISFSSLSDGTIGKIRFSSSIRLQEVMEEFELTIGSSHPLHLLNEKLDEALRIGKSAS